MFSHIKRAIKSAWKLFLRNSEISALNILILTLAISLFSLGLIAEKVLNFMILKIREKADISIYFKEEVGEEEILKLKDNLSSLPEVEKVILISKEEALTQFIQRHQQNPEILDAIKEVGNPFLASLSIQVKEPNQFENILNFLESKKEFIEKIDYFQRKDAIEKIFNFSKILKRSFYILIFFASILTIFIVFVTTQLSLLIHREEINIQKLVGASPWIIRAPFLIEAFFLVIFATLISISLFSLIFFFLSSKVENFLLGLRLFEIWKNSLFFVLILNITTGSILSLLATFFSLQRCLKS